VNLQESAQDSAKMKQITLRILPAIVALLATANVRAVTSDFTILPTSVSGTLRWSVKIGSDAAKINPTLYLARGEIYSFTVSTSTSHPFYFKTVKSTGSGNAYSSGVSTTLPVTNGTPFMFDVPLDAPDSLFYDCGMHSTMAGAINIVVFRNGFD
jgi:hypothetical protein